MTEGTIFTIGHSKHRISKFINMLLQNRIEVICDVRSSPYSSYNPQYNIENLKSSLNDVNIKYIFLGDNLGGRGKFVSDFEEGKVSYKLISSSPRFNLGIERLMKGAEQYRVSILCAEKDPINCHRSILITRALRNSHYIIQHILEDGSIENNDKFEQRLLQIHNLPINDLFHSRDELINIAYDKQAERISYSLGDKSEDGISLDSQGEK